MAQSLKSCDTFNTETPLLLTFLTALFFMDLVVVLVKHGYAPSRTTSNIRTWGCGQPGTELMTVISGVIPWKRRRSCGGMLHDDDDDDVFMEVRLGWNLESRK